MIHNNISTAEVNGFGQDSKFKLAAPNLWWVYDAFNDDSLNWLQSIYVNTANKLQAVGRSLIPELEKMLSQKLT
jgi:hypothetical protein